MNFNYTDDQFRKYLNSIGKIPLLKAEEEVIYARRIKALQQIEKLIDDLKSNYPHLEINKKLLRRILNKRDSEIRETIHQGTLAREIMVKSNLRLVVSIAKVYSAKHLDKFDLIQVGAKNGLIRAIEKFDPEKGYKFSTYGTWWIRQAVTREIAKSSRTIRIPVYVHNRIAQVKRAKQELETILKKTVSLTEIIDVLSEGKDKEKIKREVLLAINNTHFTKSLDYLYKDSDETPLLDTISDNYDNWEECEQTEVSESIYEALEKLNPREALIIKKRFGLDNHKVHTLKELEKELNISRERVRQIQGKALKKLKLLLPNLTDVVKEAEKD